MCAGRRRFLEECVLFDGRHQEQYLAREARVGLSSRCLCLQLLAVVLSSSGCCRLGWTPETRSYLGR